MDVLLERRSGRVCDLISRAHRPGHFLIWRNSSDKDEALARAMKINYFLHNALGALQPVRTHYTRWFD
jgi:hypothetical protein